MQNQVRKSLNSTERSILKTIFELPLHVTVTQDELADKSGCSKPTLSKYLHLLIERNMVVSAKVSGTKSKKYLINDDFEEFNYSPKNSFSLRDTEVSILSVYRKEKKELIQGKIDKNNKVNLGNFKTKNTSYILRDFKKISKKVNSFISAHNFSNFVAQKLKSLPKKLSKSGTLYFKVGGEWMLASKVENRFINKRYWKSGKKFKVTRNPKKPDFEWNPIYGSYDCNLDFSKVEAIDPLTWEQAELVYDIKRLLKDSPFESITFYQIEKLIREFWWWREYLGAKLVALKEWFTNEIQANLQEKVIYKPYAYIRACVKNLIKNRKGRIDEDGHEITEDVEDALVYTEHPTIEDKRLVVEIEGYGDMPDPDDYPKLVTPRLKRVQSVIDDFFQTCTTIQEFFEELGTRMAIYPKLRSVEEEIRIGVEGYGSNPKIDKEIIGQRKMVHNQGRFKYFWKMFYPHINDSDVGGRYFFTPSIEGYVNDNHRSNPRDDSQLPQRKSWRLSDCI